MGILNISGLAKLVGMNIHTIRAWEKRYNALYPERTPSGQRTYNIQDVEKLKKLKYLNELGMPIGQIAGLSIGELEFLEQEQMITQPMQHYIPVAADPSIEATPEEANRVIQRVMECLYQYDVEGINHLIQKYRASLGAKEFILQIISPLFHAIGVAVIELKLNIAQEHIVSAIVRNQISFMIHPVLAKNAPSVALATPEGDLHEFGVMLSHVLCVCNDVKSYYLGANLPVASLLSVIEHLQLKYVILGCTSQNLGYEKLSFKQYLEELVKNTSSTTKIYIGGKAALLVPLAEFGGRVEYLANLYRLDETLKNFSV